ncbi:MAG: hypothetical protein HY851_06970, partial [candidate division Zixibacteria bacterium]|nr:hypothetical protein [candidate division Zixibacteria bacterium]
MRRLVFFGVGLAGIVLALSCSKSPVVDGLPPTLTFDQLAILDTTGNFVVRWSGWDRI